MKAIESLGTFQRRGDNLDVRYERFFPRPPETVWSALTDPARLADWMGNCRLEPHAGGGVNLMQDRPRPMTGKILVWEPPQVLEYSWSNADAPNSVVRFELAREGGGTRMIFTHKAMPYISSGLMLPGWHFLFARLGSLLAGDAKPESKQTWLELQGIYVAHYQLDGVLLEHPAI